MNNQSGGGRNEAGRERKEVRKKDTGRIPEESTNRRQDRRPNNRQSLLHPRANLYRTSDCDGFSMTSIASVHTGIHPCISVYMSCCPFACHRCPATCPPSTDISVPVINEASWLAKKPTTAATSFTVPTRRAPDASICAKRSSRI